MNPQLVFYALLAMAVGALFPIQSAANALLGRGIGGPIAATIVSFSAGLVFLVSANTLVFRQWPTLRDVSDQPVYLLLMGGAIGATFLSANVFLAPRLGSAATLTFVMAGQIVGALAIDRFGLFGFALRDLSAGRILGVAMVMAGALLVGLA